MSPTVTVATMPILTIIALFIRLKAFAPERVKEAFCNTVVQSWLA